MSRLVVCACLVAACGPSVLDDAGTTVLMPAGPMPGPSATAHDAPAKPAAVEPAQQMNVLFIVWDTVRADKLSLYGHPVTTTPGLDALSARGTVYERARSPGVWTLPSHASMFTGIPVSGHGVGDDHKWLDDGFLTWAEVLRAGGWRTWAWSSNPFVGSATNLLQGFDTVEHPWDDAWQGRARKMEERKAVPEASTKLRKRAGKWDMQHAGRLAEWGLMKWLGEPASDQPWVAFINLMEAHATRSPVLEAREKVMDDATLARSQSLDRRVRRQHAWIVGAAEFSEADLEVMHRTYEASVVELDMVTSKLIDTLREAGRLDDTLIVLTSDHGEAIGEHGLMGHQLGVWDAMTHVPLIVVDPREPDGRRVADPISTAELFREVLERAGAPLPEAAAVGLGTRRDEGVVTEYTEPMASTLDILRDLAPNADLSRFQQSWTALDHGHKRVLLSGAGDELVFDLSADPGELSPLPVDPELRARIDRWRATVPAYTSDGSGDDASIDAGMADHLRSLGYVE